MGEQTKGLLRLTPRCVGGASSGGGGKVTTYLLAEECKGE